MPEAKPTQDQMANITKQLDEYKIKLKKRRKDEELALKNIELLNKEIAALSASPIVNLPDIIRIKEAIKGNKDILEGVRSAILEASVAINIGQKTLTDMEKWVLANSPKLGKVIYFDRQRSAN